MNTLCRRLYPQNPNRSRNPTKTRIKKSVINLFGVLFAVALATISACAAGTDTWVGNTAANWTTVGGSTSPANGDSLVFGATGSAGASLNNHISSLSVSGIPFNGPSAFTFAGNAPTLGNGDINASSLTSGTTTKSSAR